MINFIRHRQRFSIFFKAGVPVVVNAVLPIPHDVIMMSIEGIKAELSRQLELARVYTENGITIRQHQHNEQADKLRKCVVDMEAIALNPRSNQA